MQKTAERGGAGRGRHAGHFCATLALPGSSETRVALEPPVSNGHQYVPEPDPRLKTQLKVFLFKGLSSTKGLQGFPE